MNLLARVVLGTVAVAGLAGAAWYGYDATAKQPIGVVQFTGETARIDRADLDRLAESVRGMPAGAATLAAVREAARRMPWVRDATVRRRFPDAVEVTIEAHVPLARWTEGMLVSTQGEVFQGDTKDELPIFSGPEGSALEMAREYPAIRKALEPVGIKLTELKRSPRGAWQAVLASGLVLELGRTDMVARLERFATAWPRVAAQEPAARYADLRYPNGFALRRTKS
ncbi:cell division protein FtsQ/DivIB [Usitatibacter palustris]|uniref:Cell division protein FtsQ n=1 Tax=Usitatibacter palustris TaxID=2732487 RepID=A0A6M4H439_9PROT|nr:cell division protein FtsQ/DivIB [Usitatibacter palustris]QJR13858.1 Cell division protein FtsQ [Usitatibacter palustris]